MIRAIVFDMDGVLIDSEKVWSAARSTVVARHGGQWTERDQRNVMGDNSRQWSAYIKQTWNVPQLGTAGSARITAWAFAHHGGKLYSFVTSGTVGGGTNSQVYVLDPSSPTNTGTLLLDNTGHAIVGAGVSICAPTGTIY